MNPNAERGEAFVVWLDPDDGGGLAGHVEQVATSERVRFASADELIAVLVEAVARRTGESAAKEP